MHKFPGRVYGNPPLATGSTAGRSFDVDAIRRDYFTARGWDPETGKPSREKLLELGLDDVAKALWG
jgi:aldehyde:ferredoxin oxidoreductase